MFSLLVLLLAFVASARGALNQGAVLADELSHMDFDNIIGAPLMAVVKAQALAAKTTVAFINDVGFTTQSEISNTAPVQNEPKEILMVSFNYNQDINGTVQKKSMQVPFLFILPIPFLQIDLVTIDLNVRLTSSEKHSDSTDTVSTSSWSYSRKSWWSGSSSRMSGSVTKQEKTANSAQVDRNFNLVIHVQGSQAPMPQGMVKMFELFEAITRLAAPAL